MTSNTGWPSAHIIPAELATLVDAVIDLQDREAGCVLALVTDRHDDLVAPVIVDEIPVDADPDDLARLVAHLADIASHLDSQAGLALGVGRPGAARMESGDELWSPALASACAESGVHGLGVAIATPQGVLLADDDAAAA